MYIHAYICICIYKHIPREQTTAYSGEYLGRQRRQSAKMEQPQSPGTKPVKLRDSIEELLRFTLQYHVDESVRDIDLELPRDFCLRLLEKHPNSTDRKPALYKLLASAFCDCLGSDEQSETSEERGFSKYSNLKKYTELFHDLANMLKNVSFELHVQECYFTQLKDGLKTVEGRCAVGDYMRISSGAFILFNKCLVLEVQDVHHYASFAEMLEVEGLDKVLPGVKSIEEGVRVYRQFYPEEKERMNGVLAILVVKPNVQPYTSLARVLSELNCTGIQSLLGDDIAGVSL
ncbi:PREDICTED: uncharacterized protein LOC104820845 [Tarenaya hassleriana]|uniref:uncharacterized protein LOC104820845 n=1 Tax=Tarenaya hassleriana TaxID=28532 RepID=UPI0008FD7224|nr:PREDICTED: uncharacterized protein LOC104820845 [Tarenaya hassleriana]